MSKFLDIVEGTMPSADSTAKGEMVDLLADLLNKIPEINVISTNKPEELLIQINGSTITLHVVSVSEANNSTPEEDSESITYSLDHGVEELAAKAKSGPLGWAAGKLGSAYQQAKRAVGDRENVAKDGIVVYKRVTDSLRKAIQASKKGSTTDSINVI
jgi:hypothetical protein